MEIFEAGGGVGGWVVSILTQRDDNDRNEGVFEIGNNTGAML